MIYDCLAVCSILQPKSDEISKSAHGVSGKPSKMINFYMIPTMADFKNKIEKKSKKNQKI